MRYRVMKSSLTLQFSSGLLLPSENETKRNDSCLFNYRSLRLSSLFTDKNTDKDKDNGRRQISLQHWFCCDMGQNDTIGKIELIPFSVLSENKTNC